MQIRQGRLEDVSAVMELVARVVPIMRAAGNLQWDDEYPNAAVFEHDAKLEQLWVVEIEGQLAGMAAITTDQEPEYAQVGWDIAETAVVVHRLAVDPTFRGKGIAAALLLQAEVVARARSIAVLRIDTNTSNEATQRLFPNWDMNLLVKLSWAFGPVYGSAVIKSGSHNEVTITRHFLHAAQLQGAPASRVDLVFAYENEEIVSPEIMHGLSI